MNTIMIHLERPKRVGSGHKSRLFSAKVYCSSIANTRISSVSAIHITKSKDAHNMCVKIQYSFIVCCCKSSFENIFL